MGVRVGMGGQEQYWLLRYKISTTKSQIFGILKNLYKMFFWLVGKKKSEIVRFRASERTCVPSFIDL